MALLIAGLYLGGSVHLAEVVRKWPSRSKEPSLVNRLLRFLDKVRLDVPAWYEPAAANLLAGCSGHPIRLVIDSTKVGFDYRLLTIGLAYKRRVVPLVWSVHRSGRGHTSATEQIRLFAYVSELMPVHSEVWVFYD